MLRNLVSTRTSTSRFRSIFKVYWRGLKIYPSELRKGDWIEHEGKILIVHHITMKEPLSENLTTIKPTPKDTFEKLELQDIPHQFLYEAEGLLYFLNPKTMDEISVSKRLITPNLAQLLESGAEVRLRMNGETPVMVHTPSRHIKCTVANVIDKTLNVDRKAIIIETNSGANITCASSAVTTGDCILVNLEDLSYQGKAI